MHLSQDMRAELERRLEQIASDQAGDPAFAVLPGADHLRLLVLRVGSLLGVVLLRALWLVSVSAVAHGAALSEASPTEAQ